MFYSSLCNTLPSFVFFERFEANNVIFVKSKLIEWSHHRVVRIFRKLADCHGSMIPSSGPPIVTSCFSLVKFTFLWIYSCVFKTFAIDHCQIFHIFSFMWYGSSIVDLSNSFRPRLIDHSVGQRTVIVRIHMYS